MRSIIFFFSRAGENYVNRQIQNLPIGNTKIAAQMIQQQTGADLFEIEPAEPYPEDYSACVKRAKEEFQTHARPALKTVPPSTDDYDIIFLGYPNYCGTMPMPMFTLLEKNSFSGKIVLPFCTHEGSGLARSEEDLRKMCPDAEVRKGLAIRGATVEQAQEDILVWLQNNL